MPLTSAHCHIARALPLVPAQKRPLPLKAADIRLIPLLVLDAARFRSEMALDSTALFRSEMALLGHDRSLRLPLAVYTTANLSEKRIRMHSVVYSTPAIMNIIMEP